MAHANFQQVYQGRTLGVLQTEQPVRCSEAIAHRFPHHHLTFVQSRDETEVFVHPRLTRDEQEQGIIPLRNYAESQSRKLEEIQRLGN